MIEATCRNSSAKAPPPSTDDELGMAWWNNLSKKDRRRWMRLAGDTGWAVDAWRAFKAAAQMTGRDLDPKKVLTDLFEELHADDPEWLAEQVQRRLADSGFTIWPTERPTEPRKP